MGTNHKGASPPAGGSGRSAGAGSGSGTADGRQNDAYRGIKFLPRWASWVVLAFVLPLFFGFVFATGCLAGGRHYGSKNEEEFWRAVRTRDEACLVAVKRRFVIGVCFGAAVSSTWVIWAAMKWKARL